LKAKVDKDACIGCSLCVSTCPEVFKMVADKAVVIGNSVPGGAVDSAKRAAEECPVTAIVIE